MGWKKGYAERERRRAERNLLGVKIQKAELALAEAQMNGQAEKVYKLRSEVALMKERHYDLRERRRRRQEKLGLFGI